MDREAWRAAVHRVTESRTWLRDRTERPSLHQPPIPSLIFLWANATPIPLRSLLQEAFFDHALPFPNSSALAVLSDQKSRSTVSNWFSHWSLVSLAQSRFGKSSNSHVYFFFAPPCTLCWASQVVPVVKNPPAIARRHESHGFYPWVRKIPWRRARQPTLAFLPRESYVQREPGRLQSMKIQRVEHYIGTALSSFLFQPCITSLVW